MSTELTDLRSDLEVTFGIYQMIAFPVTLARSCNTFGSNTIKRLKTDVGDRSEQLRQDPSQSYPGRRCHQTIPDSAASTPIHPNTVHLTDQCTISGAVRNPEGISMSAWSDQVPTDGTVSLSPDPRALNGLGRNHSLETAIADLVDNSIDAGAGDVLIRLIRRRGALCSLYVVDNGCGMSASSIDNAMTVGGPRDYRPGDLGHFGLGLQSASFSQARKLTVLSRAKGQAPVGRQMTLRDVPTFHADVVPPEFSAHELARDWNLADRGSSTIIRWDDVTGFPSTTDQTRVDQFISTSIRAMSNHLGLTFHRLLTQGRINLSIDVADVEGENGPRFPVNPIDPFGYRRSARSDYPKTLRARTDSQDIEFKCHIWPGRSSLPGYVLPGRTGDKQGMYIYRRDRLLQAGGDWAGISPLGKRLALARVAIELDDDLAGLLRMNPEKSKVYPGSEFTRLAESAVADDGTRFTDYLDEAEQSYRESRKRTRKRRAMIPPGKGFASALRRTLKTEVPFTYDEDRPIEIRWRKFSDDDFFEVDRGARTLWLNDDYRSRILGGQRGGLNDAPLLKAALYLLMEEVFQGEHLGPRDKDNIKLWQEILTTAAKNERL